ncbi:DUF2894 domain-containing protein [Variovorax sp. CAN2819]|uniref:DUF2894 domain-containing protein n=1 Tax=Variovorax sp. CAN15 TaxID=3046727 RepID=UPI0026476090|nr:DUF2894 domain-containing protein [Variovorax sp. CAN15]MDN6882938.1 DUF2894 domain-containing protein [Variovorax sp. CAN15]
MTEKAEGSEAARDIGAMVAAALSRGEQRFDPVRFRFIEAMAKRATAHGGEARRMLDDKVATLLAAYDEDRAKAQPTSTVEQETAAGPSPLAELAEHIARHAPMLGNASAAPAAAAKAGAATKASAAPPAPELKSIRYFQSTWSRLSADRRLTQSLSKVPENAGPLNSHHLVHRSLTLMHNLSPEYLNRFMAYVDALSWVDQLNAGGGAAAAAPSSAAGSRAEPAKKSSRSKSS